MYDLAVNRVASESKFDVVLEQLTDLIVARELQEGDRLPPEDTLCELFAVGRSSVREALRVLETMGVVERTRRGTRIRNRTHLGLITAMSYSASLGGVGLDDLIRIRLLLEGEAAALAAERATRAQIAELAHRVERMGVVKSSKEAFVHENVSFHLAVAEASQNPLLSALIRSMSAVVKRFQEGVVDIAGVPDLAVTQHRQILEAIASRDAERARRQMEEHVSDVAKAAPAGRDGAEVEG